MPGKRKFEDQLSALDALCQQPPEAAIEPLRKALAHRNNFVVAKAADLVRQFELTQLTPELIAAFDRFMLCSDKDDPVKTDPQCWAKNALSRALATFEHQDAAVFLRGMRHIQLEPVWGGSSDTPELCAQLARSRSCNAAPCSKPTCWRILSNCSQIQTNQFAQRQPEPSSRLVRHPPHSCSA